MTLRQLNISESLRQQILTKSMTPTNIQLSSATNEHYTVPPIVEAYRQLVGSITLDPFSCEQANSIVQAEEYFSLERGQNGYLEDWKGNVFTNSPGGFINPYTFISSKRGASSMALAFDKAEAEYLSGRVEQILFVAFSLELITKRNSVFDYPVCFVNISGKQNYPEIISGGGRLKFLDQNLNLQSSPTHGSFLIYFPKKDLIEKFVHLFSKFGRVV